METILIVSLGIFSLTLFFVLINLKWCVNTVREISSSRNRGGYAKLIQMWIIFMLSLIFIVIFFYYLLNKGTVDKVDLILTVVVGWLGAIIGRFFGEKVMENLEEKRTSSVRQMVKDLQKKQLIINKLQELVRKRILKELN